jgi:ribosome maturation factor RimP
LEAKINDLLDEKFAEPAFADCFLIELKLHPNNKLEIFLDSDTGLTLERCQQISRYLEAYLDESGLLGEKYTLEVSSPGVSRPLQLIRQYPKHIGRKLKVKLKDNREIEGVLEAANEQSITLESKVVEKDGKKKKRLKVSTEVPFDDIREALVQVSFK